MNEFGVPVDRPSRPAREEFPQTASGARSDMEAVDMLNLIDSLRAELAVARQALADAEAYIRIQEGITS